MQAEALEKLFQWQAETPRRITEHPIIPFPESFTLPVNNWYDEFLPRIKILTKKTKNWKRQEVELNIKKSKKVDSKKAPLNAVLKIKGQHGGTSYLFIFVFC